MSDEQPDGPRYIKTKEIPAVTVAGDTLGAVLSEMRAMRVEQQESASALSDKIGKLAVTVDNLQHDAKDTRLRLGRMERELDEVKDRQTNNSVRARSLTEDTTEHDVAIANLTTKLLVIEEKTDAQTVILTDIRDGAKALFKNPKFLALVAAAYSFAMWWLGKHGGGQ